MIISDMAPVTPIMDLKGYLDPEQVERLMAAALDIRDRLLVRIPWRTGIRVSELVALREQDIDFENRAIKIVVLKERKRDGKTIDKSRVVPVDQGTLDMIKEYLEWAKQFPYEGDLLFPLTRQRVNQIFWKLGKKAGIKQVGDPSISTRTKMHPYILRGSFAIHCLKMGMSVKRLQEILGHQSPRTTSRYLEFSVAGLHDDYDKVWPDEGTKAQSQGS